MSQVKVGNAIQIHYTTKSPDGSVMETSINREPLQFVVGDDSMIAGLNDAVIGMSVGESKSVTIGPEGGFGYPDPRLCQNVPVDAVCEITAEGSQLASELGTNQLDVWVQARTEETITLDANHPLAGQTLILDIELVEIVD